MAVTFSPRQLAILVFFMGSVAIAYQLYPLNELRLELRNKPEGSQVTSTDANQVKGAQAKTASLGELGEKHLMGQPYNGPANVVLETTPVVDTKLKLELVGTIRELDDGENESKKDSALIREKGKKSKRYYIGDQIVGGAVLESVSENEVMLKRSGKLEALRYSKFKHAAIPETKAKAAVQPKATSAKQKNTSTTNADEPNQPRLSLRERLKRKKQQR